MASNKEYLDFVLEQCEGLTARAMMGEYVLYYGGKVVGGVYDNRLLVKPTPSAKRLMPNAPMELPYEGAKEMLLVENMEDKAFLQSLFAAIAEEFEAFKQDLIDEINALNVAGMPKLEKLNALVGGYVNLEYTLPNGNVVKFLNDSATYLGNQLESETVDRCFGIAANADFILICTYEQDGANPELVIYKKR